MKKMIIIRRASQGLFFALFVYILWSTTYPLTGILPPSTFFRLDPLLVLMTSISERIVLPGAMLSLGMLALTLLLGRFFCGWACPLGTSIDMAGALRRRRTALTETQNRTFRKIKFCIFAVIGIVAISGRQVAWVFDPIVLMARFVSLNLIPTVAIILNKIFMALIRDLRLEGAVSDLYHALKPAILGVKTEYFSHAGMILAYFLAVVGASLAIQRLWCRGLCPLGAFYALVGRLAPLHRVVDMCKECGRCSKVCRTGAIRDDLRRYDQGECILCMDCIYTCPVHGTRFGFVGRGQGTVTAAQAGSPEKGAVSRRKFLTLAISTLASLALSGFRRADEPGADHEGAADPRSTVIRPPAALAEKDFTGRCVRCGNCMKVCVTNGLQPVMLETGYAGVWTPQLVPETGYCEYHCTLCGQTCPTGAIPALTLERKLRTRLGTAEIDRSKCIPWAEGKECIVCQEHCPIPDKAIKLARDPESGAQQPYIDEYLCVGCGICQNKCPVRPVRAVRVSPRDSDRTAVQ